ncbi:MAG: hypothetical protein J0I98_19020 [Mesorhizobium sp.]|nr:hypothetical protein [Mesorhizobium sp.]MBN9244881.1 hypothetical protein [Mesorhizobium sp.]
MKCGIIVTAMLLQCSLAHAADPGFDGVDPFQQPSAKYLQQFVKAGEKVFVYERYDANGKLYQRDVAPLTAPVEIKSATERVINGVPYRLRGLSACPSPIITYENEDWDCTKAAQDYENAIYNNRASVVLCKTLVLKSEAHVPDAVSCFALVGAGDANDPYSVSYDDDAMVFLHMAAIGKNKEGRSLRPDLEKSSGLGRQFQNDEAN